jgi:hypothetical protein
MVLPFPRFFLCRFSVADALFFHRNLHVLAV